MLNLHKILFATDLSHGARWAGVYARAIARATGAELHMLFADVLHADASGAAARWTGEVARGRLQAEALEAADRESDLPDVGTKQVIRRNFSPGPAILEYAKEEDVDLIVTGTHGRRGVSRLVLGSVAEEVVRLASCPVLTVRDQGEEIPATITIGPIIAPIDFSGHSANALTYAGELARLFQADLHLLHVVEETLHPAFYGLTVQSIYDVNPHVEENAEDQMAKLLEASGLLNVDATIRALPGKAAREISDYAAELPGSFVVMGTHGLTGLDHFLMGSTTERVVRNCPSPVLSVKSFGKSLIGTTAVRETESIPVPENKTI